MENWKDWIKDKKIVFFVAETVPSYSGGGLNAYYFARSLCQKFRNVTILCYNYNNKQKRSEVIDHINIQRIPYYNKTILSKLFSLPRLIFNYYKMINKNDIVFIYGRYLIGYEFIIFFSSILHKIIVFRSTLLGDDDLESICKQSRILWLFRKYLFSKITCYYSINNFLSLKWKKYFYSSPKIFQSYQGVDIQKFHPQISRNQDLHEQLSIANECIVFFSCGFLIERKGYRDIFNAMSLLEYPFVYIIAGQYFEDSNHRSSANELAEMKILYDYGRNLLKDNIRFIGNSSMIENYFNSSDVFIHGANHEIPNVLFEAMACGIPVICRKLDNFSEEFLKNNENCYEFSNSEELSVILKNIPYKTQELNKISITALKLVREYCAFNNIIENLFKCLIK